MQDVTIREERTVKSSFTDKLAVFADRWWLVFLIAFGALAFLGVLPHKYLYHW